MAVICVIGDIISSRKIRGRPGLQARLQRVLQAINRRRRQQLLSPCTITLGDEFQAVYSTAESVLIDAVSVLETVYPTRIRFSIGVGSLDTPINRKRAIGMDGPAFHAARTGLEELKRSGFLFRVTAAEIAVPLWTNLSLELGSHLASKWKRSRLSVFKNLLQGREVKEIAKRANMTPAAVYKNIQSGALATLKSIFSEVNSEIGVLLKKR
jgi:hypothetical protein